VKTLYEILGVERTASAVEIKAAYRRAASKAHPDRQGGSEDEMKAVQHAYDVLSDAARRQQYDATGSTDNSNSIEAQAVMMLADAFRQCVEHYLSGNSDGSDPIDLIRAGIRHAMNENHTIIAKCAIDARTLAAKRKTVKHKGRGSNVHESICDVFDKGIADRKRSAEQQIKINERALEILKDYEYEGDRWTAVRMSPDTYLLKSFIMDGY